ncbi:hypothetical protein GCM10020331_008840 [Ectobacillus funiculus]
MSPLGQIYPSFVVELKSPNLWFETMKIGKVTQTDVAIMYVKGIVNDKLVQEVRQRINDIEIDGIFLNLVI